jgi:hypothetical protein
MRSTLRSEGVVKQRPGTGWLKIQPPYFSCSKFGSVGSARAWLVFRAMDFAQKSYRKRAEDEPRDSDAPGFPFELGDKLG